MSAATSDTSATAGASVRFTPGRWHARHSHLGTGPLPADAFTSKEQFELEREHIFKKVWLNVGRVEQVPNPGDFFVKEIAMCQTSILVVRGRDGEIRAFHNMCSHRGNKIAWNARGNCKVFTCKFHGWVYGLDGELRHVPDEENFFDFRRDGYGLTPVACDIWEGFIFINTDPEPQETLDEYLGELVRDLAGFPFAEFSATSGSWTTEVRANWKTVKDAFQEVYPRHGKATLWGNAEIQPTPVASVAFRHGAFVLRKNYEESQLPPGVNSQGFEDWALDLHVIFPCFFVDVSEGSYFTHNFWPIDVDRTIWQSTQYFPKPQTAGERFNQEYGHVIFRDIILEDGKTLEETQSMLASGAKREFPLQDEEILVRHSHYVVDQMIHGRPLVTPNNGNGAAHG
jgi:phenylpropionate dioxygenase-like ring-hydroxylating dioxygenase large terminal subunit